MKWKINCLFIFSLLIVSELHAAQCENVFTDGAGSFASDGQIEFARDTMIIDGSGTLDFSQIIDNTSGTSCDTQACMTSGAVTESLNLPTFNYSNGSGRIFVSGNGSASVSAGNFHTVEIGRNSTLTFTTNNGTYIIDQLTVDRESTINFPPGDYWIREFNLDRDITINVTGTGTARIFSESIQVDRDTLINDTGDPSKLVMVAYGNVDFDRNITMSGYIYSTNTVMFNREVSLLGAVSANLVTLDRDTEITYDQASLMSTDFAGLCPAVTVPLELIAHFEFDQGSGQTAIDSSTFGRNATLGNSSSIDSKDPSWECEGAGYFLDFDRTQDQRITTSAFTPPSTGTVAFWMKIPSVPTQINRIFGFGDGYEIRFDSGGKMYVDINKTGGNNTIRTSGDFTTLNTWTHFAFTTDVSTGNWAIYIDGVEDNSGKEILTAQPAASLTIGGSTRNPTNQSFNGSLEDFRIYSGLLTESEIQALAANPPQPCALIHHYNITHPTTQLTCAPDNNASITVQACTDAACTSTSSTAVTLDVTADGKVISAQAFSGSTSFDYANTTAETVTLSVANESVTATNALTCNSSSSANDCDLTFVDAAFQFYGANVGDNLSDQVAEANWQNVNLRAVQNNNGVCAAALTGNTDITFGFDCQSPSECISGRELAGIAVSGDGSGEFTATKTLAFDSNGVASLSDFNYNDAGRLTLSAVSASNLSISRGTATIDIYPSYLQLGVTDLDLVYTGGADNDTYTAGLDFAYSIGAYGANDNLLPNYQPGNGELRFQALRDTPIGMGTSDGDFAYRQFAVISTTTNPSAFTTVSGLSFSNGLYQSADAYYSESGRITLDVQDADYLGNTIDAASLALGTFIPSFHEVTFDSTVALENVHINSGGPEFSYIGQDIAFSTEPGFLIVPKNALGVTTKNYIYEGWTYAPSLSDIQNSSQVIFTDTSGYGGTVTVTHSQQPSITDEFAEFGKRVSFNSTQFRYDKVDNSNQMYAPVEPFPAQFNIDLLAPFFTDSNGVCFKDDHADTSCNTHQFTNVSGADLRFGRLNLYSTYGPETEEQQVPLVVEYFNNNQWLINTDDNHTAIAFDQSASQLLLSAVTDSANDLTSEINNITSDGILLLGESDKVGDLLINAPDLQGEVLLQLNPVSAPSNWPTYLNYDWSGDGRICNLSSCTDVDYPSATISFGLFRGNDRIIQWREVFN